MPPLPVLLDFDPGHDDAIALLLALASPEVELLGLTTTYGNQTLEKTTANAIRVLELVGRDDVPVAAGAAAPLERELEVAAHVHGESGLDGPALPAARGAPLSDDAIDFMVARVDASEQPVTIVATGPLTNVARFLSVHRGEGLARIVVMGGSIGEGNMTPAAEFNIWADPEAAQRVFSSGLDVTMIGLESSASEGSARVARMSLAELQTSVLEDPSLGSEGQRVLAWTRANMTRRGRWLARLRGRPTRSRTTKGTCSGCSSRTRISCSTTAPI